MVTNVQPLPTCYIIMRRVHLTNVDVSKDAPSLKARIVHGSKALDLDLDVSPVGAGAWHADLPEIIFRDAAGTVQILSSDDQEEKVLATQPIGPAHFMGYCDGLVEGRVQGWLAALTTDAVDALDGLELVIDGTPASPRASRVFRPDLSESSLTGGFDGFVFLLPPEFYDDRIHVAEVRHRGRTVAPGPFEIQSSIVGRLDVLERGAIAGWCLDKGLRQGRLRLGLYNGEDLKHSFVADLARGDVAAHFGVERCGFSVNVSPEFLDVRNEPSIRLLASADVVVIPPPVFAGLHDAVTAVREVAKMVRSTASLSAAVKEAVIRDIRDGLVQKIRSIPPARLKEEAYVRPVETVTRSVTVVIPVYNGYSDISVCLDSIARNDSTSEARFVVINDCSPDPRIAAEIGPRCAQLGVTFLENPENLGFVGTINRGFELFSQDDVLILNSDTVLPKGFIARLAAVARSRPNTASVTPMSNNATIMSWPVFCSENDIPAGGTVDVLDALAAKVNGDCIVELPTGHGFCMYMTRAAITAVGGFDPIWGKGYGEENDWCMRATDLGFVHLGAAGVFVGHVGGKSFGAAKSAMVERNLVELGRRYPEYSGLVSDFIQKDPLRAARRRLDFELHRTTKGPVVVHLSHSLGGGVSRHIADLERWSSTAGITTFVLRRLPRQGECPDAEYELACSGSSMKTVFRLSEAAEIFGFLQSLNVMAYHIHSLVEVEFRFIQHIFEQSARIVVTLHDYAAVCPRVTMIDGTGQFCNKGETIQCQTCIRRNGIDGSLLANSEFAQDIETWRGFWLSVLEQADAVLVPSEDARNRIRKFFPTVDPTVFENPEDAFSRNLVVKPPRPVLRALVLGAIGPHKGFHILRDMARDITQRQLPIEICVLGYTSDDKAFETFDCVKIMGPYDSGRLKTILPAMGADIGLLLSPWPETYSYVLTEMWEAGLPVLGFDLGAVGERLRASGAGWTISLTQDGGQINDRILALKEQGMKPENTTISIDRAASFKLLGQLYGAKVLNLRSGGGERRLAR